MEVVNNIVFVFELKILLPVCACVEFFIYFDIAGDFVLAKRRYYLKFKFKLLWGR